MIPSNALNSFSEFKFYQSYRIPIERADDLRFLVEIDGDERGCLNDANLVDISVTGLGFSTIERISVGVNLSVSLQFKKTHLDLTGRVVRAFTDSIDDEKIIYGVELDEDKRIHRFLEQFICSFSPERLRDCLIQSALKERYTKASDGFEMFSLLLSLFKDITNFGDKEVFVESMLDEVVRILNAQRASIFLINPHTNELEAFSAMGVDKRLLKFDYRLGIAGSVFTTGVALNIDTIHDKTRFNEAFDKQLNFQTKSIICYPFHNREDKIIGVIEVLNKRNQDRFTIEDEKTMKVISLVFSAVFHNYNPMSIKSQIRRFSNPRARENVILGQTPHIKSLRNTIIKIKDLDTPVLIQGEKGVGKQLFAKILHIEGQRGLNSFQVIECKTKDLQSLEKELWGPDEKECKLTICQGGTLVLRDVNRLPIHFQEKLLSILKERGLPDSKTTLDVRMIVTSTVDLGTMIDEGDFLPEFYEYLTRSLVTIDPLRRRLEDLPELVDYFLRMECKRQGLLFKSFTPKAMEKLQNYDWPGNVLELKQCIERTVLYNPKNHIITEVEMENDSLPVFDVGAKRRIFGNLPHISDYKIALKDRIALIEREMIVDEIRRNNGNKSQAAKAMGISREALRKKMLQSRQILDHLENNNQKETKAADGKVNKEKKSA